MNRAGLCVLALLFMGMAKRPPRGQENGMDDPSGLIVRRLKPSSWQGQFCSTAAPAVEMVKDAAAWKELWKRSFGAEAPKVDFSEHFAIAVFVGTRNTGGWGADFLAPASEGDAVVLGYRVRGPSPSAFVIQAFTQPYAIQLYRKTPRSVSVREVR